MPVGRQEPEDLTVAELGLGGGEIPGAPELRSKILTRPSKKLLQGLPVKRIDHLNVMASDVTPVKEVFERHLGFQTRERVVDGNVEIGAWMSTNLLGHEVACMRDTLGERGRFHHVAMYYGIPIPQHNIDAAEMFREYDIQIECGPDKHGITQGSFLSVFEPGGNRIELFGDAGILQFEPDYQTRTWQMADIDTGLAIGGPSSRSRPTSPTARPASSPLPTTSSSSPTPGATGGRSTIGVESDVS